MSSQSTHAPPQPELREAQDALKAGRLQEALQTAALILNARPEDTEARYVQAVALRYASEHQAALQSLQILLEDAPEYPRAFQERGHNFLALEMPQNALHNYQEAIRLNPALLASWEALATLGQQLNLPTLVQQAAQEVQQLRTLPAELRSARSMLHEGKWYKAERLCRSYLQQHPRHVEAMRILATLGLKYGILEDAEFLLESALAFEPTHLRARLDYITVLYKRQKYAAALEQAQTLRERYTENLQVDMAYAAQCLAVGDYDQAIPLYHRLTERAPREASLHLTLGHALKTVGRTDEAIGAYRQAYMVRPHFGDAYWSLANLKTYRFTPGEVVQMQDHDTEATGLEDRVHLRFALGKHFEDCAEYAASFAYYKGANALRKKQLNYSADKHRARIERHMEFFSAERVPHLPSSELEAADPIFIVGLPRSGSTLLEQILASHSQVDGTLELHNITSMAQQIDGRRRVDDEPRYPKRLAEMSADDLRALGQRYLDETRIHRQGAPYFIDKLPNNFIHIGFIRMILPQAKIIDARRHPMSCGFSNFKQLYASGQEFSYDLIDFARYYRDYVELMAHFDTIFPGAILRVQYEDVVADLDSQVRRILEYCGLNFEGACLNFHRTRRSVRTPSAEQVRQPIYTSGTEQWRHFEAELAPLREALGELA